MLNLQEPPIHVLRTFGCSVDIPKQNVKQVGEEKSRDGIYLGYQESSRCHLALALDTNRVVEAKLLNFHEILRPSNTRLADPHPHDLALGKDGDDLVKDPDWLPPGQALPKAANKGGSAHINTTDTMISSLPTGVAVDDKVDSGDRVVGTPATERPNDVNIQQDALVEPSSSTHTSHTQAKELMRDDASHPRPEKAEDRAITAESSAQDNAPGDRMEVTTTNPAYEDHTATAVQSPARVDRSVTMPVESPVHEDRTARAVVSSEHPYRQAGTVVDTAAPSRQIVASESQGTARTKRSASDDLGGKPIATIRRSARVAARNIYEGEIDEVMEIISRHPATLPSDAQDPRNLKEAQSRADWHLWEEALKKECASLLENKAFDIVPVDTVPPGVNIIKTRPVFKVKRRQDGTVERYKVRMVLQATANVDNPPETYAPVVGLSSVRTILSMCAQLHYHIYVVDVQTAFLKATIPESRGPVYATLPPNMPTHDSQGKQLCCKLRVCQYGLADAPKFWAETLSTYLVSIGFVRSEHDTCVYFAHTPSQVIVSVFVDDCLCAAKDLGVLKQFLEVFSDRFKLQRCEPLNEILGMKAEYHRAEGTIKLSQRTYTESVLKRFGMSGNDTKAVSTPMQLDSKLEEGGSFNDFRLYAELVGCLLYLASATRPDISFTVNQLSRYLTKPTHNAWGVAKRVLRYLIGTKDYGLCYGPTHASNILVGYSDASYASVVETRNSIGAYVFC